MQTDRMNGRKEIADHVVTKFDRMLTVFQSFDKDSVCIKTSPSLDPPVSSFVSAGLFSCLTRFAPPERKTEHDDFP